MVMVNWVVQKGLGERKECDRKPKISTDENLIILVFFFLRQKQNSGGPPSTLIIFIFLKNLYKIKRHKINSFVTFVYLFFSSFSHVEQCTNGG